MVERKRANRKAGLLVKSGADECPLQNYIRYNRRWLAKPRVKECNYTKATTKFVVANWPARKFNTFVTNLCLTFNIFSYIIKVQKGDEGNDENDLVGYGWNDRQPVCG